MSARNESASIVARGGAINALGFVIGVLQPLFLLFIARGAAFGLGPGTLGQYVLAMTYVGLAVKLSLVGLDKAMLRHVPTAESPEQLGRTLSTAIRAVSIASLALAIILACLSNQIVSLDDAATARSGGWWLRWMALGIPAEALLTLMLFAIRGTNRMADFVLVTNVVIPGIQLVSGVTFVVVGLGPTGVIVGHVLGLWCGLLLTAWRARRVFHPVRYFPRPSDPWERDLLRFSWPIGVTDVMNQLLGRIDIIMIGAIASGHPEYVAAYAIASQLAATVKKVRIAFDNALAPVLSKLLVRDEAGELLSMYRDVARWILQIFLAVAGITIFLAPLVLGLAHPDFARFWTLVPILVFARYLNAAGGPAQTALIMAGHSRLELLNNVLINVTNVVLNVLLIRAYGVLGAAIATATSLTLFNAMRVGQARHLVGLSARVGDAARITVAFGVAAAAAAVVLASDPLDVMWGTAATATFVAAYPAALIVIGQRRDMQRVIRYVVSLRTARQTRHEIR
jgi:O-antigen/teichoic acid export membrane protein